jgi:hypothetical protein
MLPVVPYYPQVRLREDLQEEELGVRGGEGGGIDLPELGDGHPARHLAPRMPPEAVRDAEDEVVPGGPREDRVLVHLPPAPLGDGKEAGVRQKQSPAKA